MSDGNRDGKSVWVIYFLRTRLFVIIILNSLKYLVEFFKLCDYHMIFRHEFSLNPIRLFRFIFVDYNGTIEIVHSDFHFKKLSKT